MAFLGSFSIIFLFFYLLGNVSATIFTLENNCNYTVWPGTTSSNGAALGDGGFTLQPSATMKLNPPAGWSGRFWGRTGCNFDNTGAGHCTTGDCGGLKCTVGGAPPVSLVEFTLNGDGGQDIYDVSLVDGYNVGIEIRPTEVNCQYAGCVDDLNGSCPSELQLVDSGSVVACRSACEAFNTDEYCCRGAHNTAQTCSSTNYSKLFKKACPTAYSYAYDDATSIFTCTAGSDYYITFCPFLAPQPPPKGNVSTTIFTLENNCSYTVWPGTTTTSKGVVLGAGGFRLPPNVIMKLNAPADWSGRFWARTGCTFDDKGVGNCTIGDCTGGLKCKGGGATPVSLLEITLNGDGGEDYYNVSLVDGYNVGIGIRPTNGRSGYCQYAGCVADINGSCPSELQVLDSGSVVACKSACEAFNTDEYCCKGAHNEPETCPPTNYSKLFKKACPSAYSYVYDDAASTFNCTASDYLITFCPSKSAPGYKEGRCHGVAHPSIRCMINRTTILGLIICSGSVLLVVSSYGLYRLIRRQKKLRKRAKFFKRNGGLLLQQQMISTEGIVEKTKIFAVEELEKATNDFNINRVLGQGGQGTVYKGILPDGRVVAIKKSKKVDESLTKYFINEVVILSQINHRNVVKLLGCCLETEVPLLVYEFIPNGALSTHIHTPNEDCYITWKMRLHIAAESAGAISYLHSSSSTPVYHRDIKSSNILLDESCRAKVSDFGLSRSIGVDQTHLTATVHGTFGYLDPEFYQTYQYTEKSDVYSFGVVLVELLTSKKPILLSTESGGWKNLSMEFIFHMNNSRLSDILDSQVLQGVDEEEIMEVANLAMKCLNNTGKKRPSMKEVAMTLERIILTHVSNLVTEIDPVEEDVVSEMSTLQSNCTNSMTFFSENGINAACSIEIQPLVHTV